MQSTKAIPSDRAPDLSRDWPKILHVGPWRYRLLFVPDLHHKGSRVAGLFDAERMTIEIAGDLSPQWVRMTILHELRHAWAAHVPPPRDAEQECDLTAMIVESFRQDMARHRRRQRGAAHV